MLIDPESDLGKLKLAVTHYLASVILPAGCCGGGEAEPAEPQPVPHTLPGVTLVSARRRFAVDLDRRGVTPHIDLREQPVECLDKEVDLSAEGPWELM